MRPWTRAHARLVDAYVDIYRVCALFRRPPRTLESWLGQKFATGHAHIMITPRGVPRPDLQVADLTVAQARQARRCLRAWAWSDGFGYRRRV